MKFLKQHIVFFALSFAFLVWAYIPQYRAIVYNSEDLTAAEKLEEGNDMVIRFERINFYDPIYKLSVYGSGKVVYKGRERVKVYGKKVSSIDKTSAEKLFAKIREMDFLNFKDAYGETFEIVINLKGTPPDRPLPAPTRFQYYNCKKISVTLDGKEKAVRYCSECLYSKDIDENTICDIPETIPELEDLIFETTKAQQWIGDKR